MSVYQYEDAQSFVVYFVVVLVVAVCFVVLGCFPCHVRSERKDSIHLVTY